MKKVLSILLLLPLFVGAQTNNNSVEQSSSTDCPDWKNQNQPRGNADFYKSLRSMKPTNKTMAKNEGKVKSGINNTEKPAVVATQTSKTKTPIKERKEDIATSKKEEKDEKKKKTKQLKQRKCTSKPNSKSNSCPNF